MFLRNVALGVVAVWVGGAAGADIPAPGTATGDGFTVAARWTFKYRSRGMKEEKAIGGPLRSLDAPLNFRREVDGTAEVTEEVNKATGKIRAVIRDGHWSIKISNLHYTDKHGNHVGAGPDAPGGGDFKRAAIGYGYDEKIKKPTVSFSISSSEGAESPKLAVRYHPLDEKIFKVWVSGDIKTEPFISGVDGACTVPFTRSSLSYHKRIPEDGSSASFTEITIERVPRNIEAEIKPSGDFKNWVPTVNGAASFEARIIDPPGLPADWQFSLTDVSTLPGICNNANMDNFPNLAGEWQNAMKEDSPDLLFDFRHYGKTDKTFQAVSPPWKELHTAKPVSGVSVAVSCLDYGASGRISAKAWVDKQPVEVQWRERKQNFIQIPWAKDASDDSHIAHAAKPHGSAETYDQLSHGGKADSDEDNYPAGYATCRGDGLTLFEEYRGFYVRADFDPNAPNIYRRLYPDVKDFFVFMNPDDAVLLGKYLEDFQKASGLMVHRIGNDELTEFIDPVSRVVNFNRLKVGSPEKQEAGAQHAVQLVDFDLPEEGTIGQCSPRLGPPIHVNSVSVAVNKINRNVQQVGRAYRDYLKQVVIHELGHAVAIEHHGNFDDFHDPNYGYVAYEGAQHSGNFDCAMRYIGADFYLHWGSTAEPDPKYHRYSRHEHLGMIFCDSRKGTGLNDRSAKNWQCGDALIGGCKMQIVVNDHCGGGSGSGSDVAGGQNPPGTAPRDAPEMAARKSQGAAKVSVRLSINDGESRSVFPGEFVLFKLRLTGLAGAKLELGRPNESWTKQVEFKILDQNGKLLPSPLPIRGLGTPTQQTDLSAPDGPLYEDKPTSPQITVTPKALFRSAFALDGDDVGKIAPGEYRIFATLNNGSVTSNGVRLTIRRFEQLSAEEQARADTVRMLSRARVADADDKLEDAERLAREVVAKAPDMFEARLFLARTLEKEKKLREAYDEYGKALQTWKPPSGKVAEAPQEILFARQALAEQLQIEVEPPPLPRPFVSHTLFAESSGNKLQSPFPTHLDHIVFEAQLATASDDPLGVRWIATDTAGIAPPNHVIATGKSEPRETKPRFTLKTPTNGFPPGDYRIEVWQGGKPIYRENFAISP